MPANLCDLKHTEEREAAVEKSRADDAAWERYGVGPSTPRPEPLVGMTSNQDHDLWRAGLTLLGIAEAWGTWDRSLAERLLAVRAELAEIRAMAVARNLEKLA